MEDKMIDRLWWYEFQTSEGGI